VTRLRTVVGDAPKVAATTSYSSWADRNAPSTETHEVRHRDERLCDNNGCGGEREIDAEGRQVTPEPSSAAQRDQERQPGDDRW